VSTHKRTPKIPISNLTWKPLSQTRNLNNYTPKLDFGQCWAGTRFEGFLDLQFFSISKKPNCNWVWFLEPGLESKPGFWYFQSFETKPEPGFWFRVYSNPKNLGLGSKTLKTGTGSKIINWEVTFFTFPNGSNPVCHMQVSLKVTLSSPCPWASFDPLSPLWVRYAK